MKIVNLFPAMHSANKNAHQKNIGDHRNSSIDTIRGFACLLLVLYHVIGAHPGAGLRIAEDNWVSIFNQTLGLIRMPMFAMLSGYVYAARPFKGEYREFTLNKTRRLLVPTLIVGTGFAALQSFAPGVNSEPIDWRLIHIIPVAHYWFLESIFILFMLTMALETCGVINTVVRMALFLILIVAAHTTINLPWYFGINGALYLAPYFFIGIFAKRFPINTPSMHVSVKIFACSAIAAAIYYAHHEAPPPHFSVISLAVGASFSIILIKSNWKNDLLEKIGIYSFSIFLFHPIFSAAARVALAGASINFMPFLIIAGWISGIFFPIIAEKLLRKTGMIGHFILGEKLK